jgi:hypothetical protein
VACHAISADFLRCILDDFWRARQRQAKGRQQLAIGLSNLESSDEAQVQLAAAFDR